MRLNRAALYGATILSTCCFVEAAAAQSTPAPAAAAPTVGEVVVTAERHNSTILKTPISMSAETGKDLAAKGITTIEGIVADVPGLSMRSAGPGQTEYEARGVASNGGSSSTVGFYLNDVPLSAPASGQTGKVVIDPNLYDINHVEVLRGPQGTLYGSSSEAGTIRIATNQPVLNAYEASVETVGSGTVGGGANGAINAMVNVPVGDKLAIRAVVGDLDRSGWINRYVLNPFPLVAQTDPLGSNGRGNVLAAPVADTIKDVNTEKLWTGRVTALYTPTQNLAITAMAFHQEMVMGGYDQFQSPPGPSHEGIYQAFNIKEPIIDKISIYSLSAVQNLGFADLTSATS